MEKEPLTLSEKELLAYAFSALRAAKEGNFDLARELLIKASGSTKSSILSVVSHIETQIKMLEKERNLKEEIDYLQKLAESKFYF